MSHAYKTVNSASVSNYHFGIDMGLKIQVACGRDLSDKEKEMVRSFSDNFINEVMNGSISIDNRHIEEMKKEKRDLLLCFPPYIFVEEIPNEYWAKSINPWFIITTTIGRIKIGWRKRVIVIDWTQTTVKQSGEALFPTEDTTRGATNDTEGQYIHAWGYEKAHEYIAHLLSLAD